MTATIPRATTPISAALLASTQAVHSHIFTVDVEEYFQVNAFDGLIERSRWHEQPSRLEASVDEVLSVLARFDTVGTFFTLGWIAERHSALVRRIAEAGHEIASHGWWHRKVGTMSPNEFREDVRSSKQILEDVSGRQVRGFRAPSFSIAPGGEWAFDILLEEGYSYDSSLFPIRRPGYGYPGAPREPHLVHRDAGALMELPLTTTSLLGARVPAAGGGYLRHFPFQIIQRAFREHEQRRIPAVFYIHPWELDADQPRLPVSASVRLRHYAGLHRTKSRIERLLQEFAFTSVERRMSASLAATGPTSLGMLPA